MLRAPATSRWFGSRVLLLFGFLVVLWVGGYIGPGRLVRDRGRVSDSVNAVPRPIPEKKWFMEPWVIIPLGGILPFGSIFIEM